MELLLPTIFIVFSLFLSADAQTCPASYYLCSGSEWCCSDGYVCTGSSTCLSIGAIVGACIGGLVAIGLIIFFIYLCVRAKKGSVSSS